MLDGVWIAQAAEFSGESLPVPESRWVIAGTRYVVESAAGRDEGDLLVDAEATPLAVDLVGRSGPNGDKTIRAIFRLRGDLMQLCYDVGGDNRRPSTFAASRGSMRVLVRYRRISESVDNEEEKI